MFVIKEFQITCLILLTDCAKDINVPYLLATAENRSRIKRESEYNILLSLTNIFFQKTNFIWSIWYVIGMLEQKYCNGLTLSRPRQQQLKICLKQLFQVTFILLRVLSQKTAYQRPTRMSLAVVWTVQSQEPDSLYASHRAVEHSSLLRDEAVECR